MKGFIISVIAVLGIALAASVARNATLERKLKENEAETTRFVNATENVLWEIEDYVLENYGDSVRATIWQGPVYDEWYGAFEAIVCL